eukprot:757780-Hanusia_phi.AAC.4
MGYSTGGISGDLLRGEADKLWGRVLRSRKLYGYMTRNHFLKKAFRRRRHGIEIPLCLGFVLMDADVDGCNSDIKRRV